MRHVRGFYDLGSLQLYVFRPEVVEQPDPATEQHGHDVHVYLVQQPGLETLLNEARRANRDVLLARQLPGLFDRALYAIRDEGERGSLVVPAVGDGVGKDEDRYVEGMPARPSRS